MEKCIDKDEIFVCHEPRTKKKSASPTAFEPINVVGNEPVNRARHKFKTLCYEDSTNKNNMKNHKSMPIPYTNELTHP